jgi:cell division protein FtsB
MPRDDYRELKEQIKIQNIKIESLEAEVEELKEIVNKIEAELPGK